MKANYYISAADDVKSEKPARKTTRARTDCAARFEINAV